MTTLKTIGIFLAVLLAIFIVVGAYYGALFFFFVLKLMGYAVIGVALILLFIKSLKNKNPNE